MSSSTYKMETSSTDDHLDRARTAGGHIEDRSQPALPVVHRRLANPAPLGLLSFATGKSTMLFMHKDPSLT
jgi:succinate-acetate transporter protein